MNAGVQKQNLAPIDNEMENQQQRDISKLKEKFERAYYHVTQKESNKRPRLQKLQSMLKLKETVKNAYELAAGIVKDKDLNLAETNHFIYAAATVLIEVNGAGCYRSKTHSPKTPPWVRQIG
jgi:DNA relaxase NicK